MSRYHALQWINVWVFLFLILNSQQPAQVRAEVDERAIDSFIEAQMRELKIPGLAVAIVRGDQIETIRGYGTADDAGRPVTPQTPFLVASFSKSITALGIMQLVEDGKINLDAPVQTYLPWFQAADTAASAKITVRHLLHQTSGFSESEGYERNLERNQAEDALETSVRALRRARLSAAPGERFEYSNTNYDVLGLLIQTVSGEPYETYIEENIFAPLQMKNAFTSLDDARAGGVSSGYINFFGQTLNYDRFMPYARAVVPSAGLFASAEDMAHYLYAQLNQGRAPGGESVLSPAGMDELHTPGARISDQVSYAMGWTLFPFKQAAAAGQPDGAVPSALSHGGEWANFKALMVFIPERQVGVAILMNKMDHRREQEYEAIAWNTALLALGSDPVEFPRDQGFLTQYGHIAGVVVILLLAAGLAWSARILFRQSQAGEVLSRGETLTLLILLLADVVLSAYILRVELANSSLPLTLYFTPEVGLLYLIILSFCLGWGVIRAVWLAVYFFGRRASLKGM